MAVIKAIATDPPVNRKPRVAVNPKKPKPAKINNKRCPDIKLAPNLIPKLKPFAIYDINSIKANKGTNNKGVPSGEKRLKNLKACSIIPIIVTPNHILELIDKVLTK
jgi:hypothetical protein